MRYSTYTGEKGFLALLLASAPLQGPLPGVSSAVSSALCSVSSVRSCFYFLWKFVPGVPVVGTYLLVVGVARGGRIGPVVQRNAQWTMERDTIAIHNTLSFSLYDYARCLCVMIYAQLQLDLRFAICVPLKMRCAKRNQTS